MLENIRHSLVLKLIFSVGVTLLLIISTWAYFNIRYQKERIMKGVVEGTARLSNTIMLGTHYAMMLNSRDDINQIIQNIGKQKEIENIRIYNKEGAVKFSNRAQEIDQPTQTKAEACVICHRTDIPQVKLELSERIRLFRVPGKYPLLGITSPIYNEPGCSKDCHVHPQGKKILGALDLVVSLNETDLEIVHYQNSIVKMAIIAFLVTSVIILIIVLKFVRHPIKKLINKTQFIAKGEYQDKKKVYPNDEIGQLAVAINRMGKEIGKSHAELNRQRDEYQNLFELVPCIITVQDRNYMLLNYNRQFFDKFDPRPGDLCFYAYKKRNEKCENCPVEKTFEDGLSHYSEETGLDRDGSVKHWLVVTSPVKNDKGEIVAAMEICLDITPRKLLEEKLEESEKKYHDIFNNIPNPVFVVSREDFKILNCNESVAAVYGYTPEEIIRSSFMDLFTDKERASYASQVMVANAIDQVRHITKEGRIIFVNIRISPSEYAGQEVLLMTSSDITKRLEAEQQLIQASKMATLGEMATGVAHELNQPLSVIKTASSFFMKKIRKEEDIRPDILLTMASEIDSHVDRASKIINHMREFGRKSDMGLERVQVNHVLEKAFEIFSQQLKVRGIRVIWELEKDLPMIMADPSRLEQVFINLLINARDAIEEQGEAFASQGISGQNEQEKTICLITRTEADQIVIEVEDTGKGIPPEVLDKIFEPFFTTKEVGKGTGLGLSISYGIIKDCGGNIRAAPNEGKGALFVIRFPIPG